MTDLTALKCTACEGGTPPLDAGELDKYFSRIFGWQLDLDRKVISKEYQFKDFAAALNFVNLVGGLAESEGHHPDIFLHAWNKVRITLSTHAIHGLSPNDFILAAKIDTLPL